MAESRSRDLRDQCAEVALKLIGEVGVEGLSIREVARRLGVSHQAPYKHFASSNHLLAEVVRRMYADFSAYLLSRPKGRNEAESMENLSIAYFEFAMRNPLHYRLMFGNPLPNPDQHPEMMSEARAAFTILLDSIAAARGGKNVKLDQLDALFVWSSLHGLSTILRTCALDEIGLKQAVLSEALPHTLMRIGVALGI